MEKLILQTHFDKMTYMSRKDNFHDPSQSNTFNDLRQSAYLQKHKLNGEHSVEVISMRKDEKSRLLHDN